MQSGNINCDAFTFFSIPTSTRNVQILGVATVPAFNVTVMDVPVTQSLIVKGGSLLNTFTVNRLGDISGNILLTGGLGLDSFYANVYGMDGNVVTCGAYMLSQSGNDTRYGGIAYVCYYCCFLKVMNFFLYSYLGHAT